jgi:LmbE family N-acetylglucosaminyl deacetylase
MAAWLTYRRARRLANALTRLWARPLSDANMRAPAIVFSPHEDDETLACGGTILKKRRLGASVHVVFMTDGTTSPHNLSADQLVSLREKEARAACGTLGVAPDHVTFFRFQDGQLLESAEPARQRVAEFLDKHPADQVFVPYHQDRDPGLDHIATHQIVSSALQTLDRTPVLYEYPVWYWRFWPQIRTPVRGQLGAWNTEPNNLLARARDLTDFNASVAIDDVLDLKRAALEQHRSQLKGLNSIRSGGFMRWFFGQRELFYRHTVSPRGR